MSLRRALWLSFALAGCSLLPSAPFDGTTAMDVENRSSVDVIVSWASDTAADLPGFEAGDRGTIVVPLLNPTNGMSVEIQGTGVRGCELLASAMFETPDPFTLLIDDGPAPGMVVLSTRPGVSLVPIPMPANGLHGCGG